MAFEYKIANKEQNLAVLTTETPLLIIVSFGFGKIYTHVKRTIY